MLSSYPASNETILLVDDDSMLAEISSSILEMSGYHVLTAANGREAIDILQSQSLNTIDLFILDVVMPVMGGVAFAEWILARNPHAKIIFYTGSDKDNELKGFLQRFETCVLLKPCPVPQLKRAIRAALK